MEEQGEKVKDKYIERHGKNHGNHKFQFNGEWIKIGKVREFYPHLLVN